MKFLEFIKNGFSRVLSVDAEYLSDLTGTIPQRILCLVFKDIFTKEKFRYWVDDKEIHPPFFDYKNCLLISFNAVAEHGAFLELYHGKPKYMWDCYIENKCLYGPFLEKNKTGLLDTCARYNIGTISEEDKDKELDFILRRGEYADLPFKYSEPDQKRIMDYCLSDVEELEQLFIAQCQDIEAKNKLITDEDFERTLFEITFRGYSQGNIAQIQRYGIPVDTKLISRFNKYWELVKNKIITGRNKSLNIYTDDLKFNREKFKQLVIRCGLRGTWPLLKSGHFTANDDVVKRYEHRHPLIKEFRQLNKLLNTTKLSFYKVGHDGRVRADFNMFGTITSRCTPSSSKYPLNASKWVRNFIKPSWGTVLYYLDYKAQEPGIMAHLSGDQVMLDAYNSHDIYITTAQKLGMINDPNATKETHETQRDVVKELFLANSYGMGVKEVARRLECSRFRAREYLKRFKELYKTYFNKRETWINGSAITGHLRSPLGWQRWIKGNKKWKDGKKKSITNQLKNFIIQTTGADILRKAIQKLLDNHIKVIALLHDAVIIEVPIPELWQKDYAKSLMEIAAKDIVGGIIRVDEEVIETNWKQKEKHQELFDEIFKEIEIYENQQPTNDLLPQVLTVG